MNISYNPKEDRLLLKISSKNNDEYRLWLTRRYSGLLLKLFQDEIDKHGGEPRVASSDEAKKMYQNGALEKPYEAESTNFPLGEDGVLGFRINKGDRIKIQLDI